MREHSRDKGRLEDIKQYGHNVETILDGITFDGFVQDIRVYYSVMKNIEVIGEAANMLTKDFKEQHPELPWRQIVKMRNVLVHGYAQVSDVDLWETATKDIKVLLGRVESYLSDVNWDEWNNTETVLPEIDNTLYNNAVQIARKMKVKGFQVFDIMEITGLTEKEINEL